MSGAWFRRLQADNEASLEALQKFRRKVAMSDPKHLTRDTRADHTPAKGKKSLTTPALRQTENRKSTAAGGSSSSRRARAGEEPGASRQRDGGSWRAVATLCYHRNPAMKLGPRVRGSHQSQGPWLLQADPRLGPPKRGVAGRCVLGNAAVKKR